MTTRVEHIDIAKGISISLVAMFHSELAVLFSDVLNPMGLFRLPLFFFLSGVFFSYSASAPQFVFKKAEALLKPYFAVLLMLILVRAAIYNEPLLGPIKGMLYGNGNTIRWVPMWFLTHLFVVYVFSYAVHRFTPYAKFSAALKVSLLVIMLAVGTRFLGLFWQQPLQLLGRSISLPGLPFSADIVLVSSAFFMLGHVLKQQVIDFVPHRIALVLAAVALVAVIVFTSASIDLNNRQYAQPVFATLAALSAIYLILSLSYGLARTEWPRRILLRLGASSLYILIFHEWIGDQLFWWASRDVSAYATTVALAILAFVLSVSLPLLIKWLALRSSWVALFFMPLRGNALVQGLKSRFQALGLPQKQAK